MSLRPTQVETLKLMASSPDKGHVWTSDIAMWADRSIRAAEQRLGRLVETGHVAMEWVEWDRGPVQVWTLTPKGWAACTPDVPKEGS